jgi:hypothetical protein
LGRQIVYDLDECIAIIEAIAWARAAQRHKQKSPRCREGNSGRKGIESMVNTDTETISKIADTRNDKLSEKLCDARRYLAELGIMAARAADPPARDDGAGRMSAAAILSQANISDAWRALGGPPLRRTGKDRYRARAWWRERDGWTISVDDSRGVWFDHRDAIGGDVLDLVVLERRRTSGARTDAPGTRGHDA